MRVTLIVLFCRGAVGWCRSSRPGCSCCHSTTPWQAHPQLLLAQLARPHPAQPHCHCHQHSRAPAQHPHQDQLWQALLLRAAHLLPLLQRQAHRWLLQAQWVRGSRRLLQLWRQVWMQMLVLVVTQRAPCVLSSKSPCWVCS
jgi:hypothetical protein